MTSQSTVSFKIENNVLSGEEDTIDDKCNVGELILSAFKSRPDFIGQVDPITEEENTFQQMRERSVKCALWLKKFGVQRNDIVTVCTSNHLNTYIPYLASLYIGATLTVWHENRSINLRYYMQSSPKVIFTDIDKAPLILNVANMMEISTKIIVFIEEEEEEEEKEEEKEEEEEEEDEETIECLESILNSNFDKAEIDEFSCTKLESSKDTAVILYSAGTIGDIRKHVTIPYAFFTSPSNQHVPIMSSNDVGLWNESLHWNISLLLTVRCILSYVKAVKIHEFSYPSLEKCFCNIIEKYKVTWAFLKMSMGNHFYRFSAFRKHDVSSLKQIIFGGKTFILNNFDNFIISLPDASVIQVYCLPETGMITYQNKTGKRGSSGYVCKTVSLIITNYINGSLLEANKLGIIWCKSPSLTNGCFSSIPAGDLIPVASDNGWFCTDDVGYYDTNGELYVRDRKKYVIQYRNSYFLPASIEQVLLKHPKVEECAVIPLFNTFDVHHPLAFIVLKEGSKVAEQELIQFVSDNVIDCMKLRGGVLFRPALQYLSNEQLDRRTLSKWAKDDLKDKAYRLKKASQKKT